MYCTEKQAKDLWCWRTLGTDKEKKCAASRCSAWEWFDDVYYISNCPHCKKVITGLDLKGMLDGEPLGYCAATRRR